MKRLSIVNDRGWIRLIVFPKGDLEIVVSNGYGDISRIVLSSEEIKQIKNFLGCAEHNKGGNNVGLQRSSN